MKVNTLRDFVRLLEARGELVRVHAPVSAELEITEIVERVSKEPAERNKALLFENVTGYDMPVLINMFGSAQRMAWALHVDDLDEPWLMPRDAVEAVCWAALLGSLSRTAVRELAVAAHAGRAHSIPDGDAGPIAYYRALALGPNAVLAKPVIQMIQTAAHPAARLWGARQLARIVGPMEPTSQGRPRRR